MKKYKFRLENVLKVRALHRKLAEKDVAQTQAKLNRTDSEIKACHEAIASSFEVEQSESQANLAFLHQVSNQYRMGMLRREHQLKEQKDKLAEKLESEKSALTRRMREEQAIEQLKEYDFQNYQKEALSEEQKLIEELDILKRGNR